MQSQLPVKIVLECIKCSLRPHVLHILHRIIYRGFGEESMGSRDESPPSLLATLDEPLWDAGLLITVVERSNMVPENARAGFEVNSRGREEVKVEGDR